MDYQIDEAVFEGVFVNFYYEGFSVAWSGDRGFGHIGFRKSREDSVLLIDSEAMSKEFIKAVLCKMVDDAEVFND